jgi:hypothetical protein
MYGGDSSHADQEAAHAAANARYHESRIPSTIRGRADWMELEGKNFIDLNIRRHAAQSWIEEHTDDLATGFAFEGELSHSRLMALGAGHKARQKRAQKKKPIKRQQARTTRLAHSRIRRTRNLTANLAASKGASSLEGASFKVPHGENGGEIAREVIKRLAEVARDRNQALFSSAKGNTAKERKRRRHRIGDMSSNEHLNKEDFVDNHTDMDLQSTERLAQQALVLRAERFGFDADETKAGVQLLRQIYAAQHMERHLEIDELDREAEAHIHRLRQRKSQMADHLAEDSSKSVVGYAQLLLSPVELRGNQSDDNASEAQSHSMLKLFKRGVHKSTRVSTDAMKSELGNALTHVSSKTAILLMKNQEEAQLRARGFVGEKVPGPEVQGSGSGTWRTSNRLVDPSKAHVDSADRNTASMMRRLARREYSLVMAAAGHEEAQVGGSGSTVVKAILATATAAARSYPTVDDFRADVNVDVILPQVSKSRGSKQVGFSQNLDGPQREPPGGTLIVGESFRVKYSYRHPEGDARHHPDGDWLGLFNAPSSVAQKELTSHSDSHLMAWCAVPHGNDGEVPCEHQCNQPGEYRVAYVLQESQCVVASSKIFLVRRVRAHLSVPKTVKCGKDLIVKYFLDYRRMQHAKKDVIVLMADDGSKPNRANAIKVAPLPKENEGFVAIPGGVVYPGLTRACLLLSEYGDDVAGEALFFAATVDLKVTEMSERLQNRQIGIYLSTQWDMEEERRLFHTVVVPQLLEFCASRSVVLDIFEPRTTQSQCVHSLCDERHIHDTLTGISASRPLFVCCLGDRAEPKVPPQSIYRGAGEDYAWLQQIIAKTYGRRGVSITELEVLAAFLVPQIQHPLVSAGSYFYTRHPSLGSFTHPATGLEFQQCTPEKLREIAAANRHVASIRTTKQVEDLFRIKDQMRVLKRQIAAKTDNVRPNYRTPAEWASLVTLDLINSIDGMFPEDTVPDTLGIVNTLSDALRARAYPTGALEFYGERRFTENIANVDESRRLLGTRFGFAKARMESEPQKRTIHEVLTEYCSRRFPHGLVLVDDRGVGTTTALQEWMRHYSKISDASTKNRDNDSMSSTEDSSGESKSDSDTDSDSCQSSNSADAAADADSNLHGLTTKAVFTRKKSSRHCLILHLELRDLRHFLRWGVVDVVHFIVSEMHRTLGTGSKIPPRDDCVFKVFLEWLGLVQGEQHGDLVLILDGLDDMDLDQDETRDPLFWLPRTLPPGVWLIASCLRRSRAEISCTRGQNVRGARSWKVISTKARLSLDMKEDLIHRYTVYHGKYVRYNDIQQILSPNLEVFKSHRYLRVFLDSLLVSGKFPQHTPISAKRDLRAEYHGSRKGRNVIGMIRKDTELLAQGVDMLEADEASASFRDEISSLLMTCDKPVELYVKCMRSQQDVAGLLNEALCCLSLSPHGLSEYELSLMLPFVAYVNGLTSSSTLSDSTMKRPLFGPQLRISRTDWESLLPTLNFFTLKVQGLIFIRDRILLQAIERVHLDSPASTISRLERMEQWWECQPFSERKAICRPHLLEHTIAKALQVVDGEGAQHKLVADLRMRLFSAITDVNAFMVLYGSPILRHDFVKYLKLSQFPPHKISRAVRTSFQAVHKIDTQVLVDIGQDYHKLRPEHIGVGLREDDERQRAWTSFLTHAPEQLLRVSEFLLHEANIAESAGSMCEAVLLMTLHVPALETSQLADIVKWEPPSLTLAHAVGKAVRILGDINLRYSSSWLTVALDHNLVNEDDESEVEQLEAALDDMQSAGVPLGRNRSRISALLLLPPVGSEARTKVEPAQVTGRLAGELLKNKEKMGRAVGGRWLLIVLSSDRRVPW